MPSHRSRLGVVLVDVPRSGYDREVDFWQTALQRDGVPEAGDPDYTEFGEPTPGVQLTLQAVDDEAPRIHLDIETDDVEAEVVRLAALGATELRHHEGWVVMRDPVGIVFCVVPVQVKDAFEANAATWTT